MSATSKTNVNYWYLIWKALKCFYGSVKHSLQTLQNTFFCTFSVAQHLCRGEKQLQRWKRLQYWSRLQHIISIVMSPCAPPPDSHSNWLQRNTTKLYLELEYKHHTWKNKHNRKSGNRLGFMTTNCQAPSSSSSIHRVQTASSGYYWALRGDGNCWYI